MGLLLALLAMLESQQPQVPPDFTASTVTVSPARPRAGDVIRYEIKVTNRGGLAGTSIVTTELPFRLPKASVSAPSRQAAPASWCSD